MRRIAFVTTYDSSNACWRLQTDAVQRGSREVPELCCQFFRPDDAALQNFDPAYIGFHYNDVASVAFLRQLRAHLPDVIFIGFGSDIYAYHRYAELADIVDLFVMPTIEHKRVLAAHVSVPIAVLAEPVDPLALVPNYDWVFPLRQKRRLGWFGYPESFYKGMYSLLPVIDVHIRGGGIDDFVLLTDETRFPNDFELSTRPFSPSGFAADLFGFDYVITSHFPLDLQVNSMIKSPNKAMAALVAGAIPLVSDTPAYRALFEELGLTRFIIESPRAFDLYLKHLNPQADSQLIRDSGALEKLRSNYNDGRVAQDFLQLLVDYEALPEEWRVSMTPTSRLTYIEFEEQRRQFRQRLGRVLKRWRRA